MREPLNLLNHSVLVFVSQTIVDVGVGVKILDQSIKNVIIAQMIREILADAVEGYAMFD